MGFPRSRSLVLVFALGPVVAALSTADVAHLASLQQPPAQPTLRDPSVLRISVDLVQIDATVTTADGRHVTDLTAKDFEILQDGRAQPISTFAFVPAGGEARPVETPGVPAASVPTTRAPRAADIRRTIAIVVDDLNLSFESVRRVQETLRRFVDTAIRPGDLVAILRTGAGMGALQQFTTDTRLLHAAVDRVRWNMAARISPFEPSSELDRRTDPTEIEFATAGSLGAIQYVVRGVSDLPGRKSVILLSDGFRMTDADRTYGRIRAMVRALADSANRAGVVIYGIDLRGLVAPGTSMAEGSPDAQGARAAGQRAELAATQDGMEALAAETGGLFLTNRNDITGAVRRALDDQQGYYLLGYVPPASTFSGGNAPFRSLTVRVTRPGLRVRSRSGFFARPQEDRRGAVVDRMVAAVTSPFAGGDIRLRLTSLFAQDAKLGPTVHSFMHVDPRDLSFTDEADGARVAQIELLAMTFGENGEVADRDSRRYTVRLTPERYAVALQNGFIYNVRLPVKRPGPYQLRIALRDAGSDRIGSASQFVDVPDLKRRKLTLSGLVVQGTGADGDANATVAVRRFRQGTAVTYVCNIYNAQRSRSESPQVESEVRLLRDGVAVFRGGPHPTTAQTDAPDLAAAGTLQLDARTPPGTYVLELTVTDRRKKGARVTQSIDFDVIE